MGLLNEELVFGGNFAGVKTCVTCTTSLFFAEPGSKKKKEMLTTDTETKTTACAILRKENT